MTIENESLESGDKTLGSGQQEEFDAEYE